MRYHVKALQNESVLALTVDATDATGAAEQVRAQGYAVLHISQPSIWRTPLFKLQRNNFSALQFSQELSALLTAGLSLIEALDALKRKNQHDQSGTILENIVTTLSEGKTFSAAIAQYPQHFSPLYIATIQASEKTGDLPQALQRFIDYQQQIDRVRKKLISASLYPLLLTGVGTLVVLFLLLYVIPRFSKVYESFSGDLPFFSKILIVLGTFISNHSWLLIAILLAIIASTIWTIVTPAARSRIQLWINHVPVIAEQLRLYELTRLYRTLGMLLRGGVPVTRATGMSSALLREDARNRLTQANRLITEGRAMSAAFDDTGLTTPIASRMLIVGERTGNMGVMMERIALFHEEELARRIEDASKLFEPLLMLGIGLAVGAVVVLMYMPIFELATAIQ